MRFTLAIALAICLSFSNVFAATETLSINNDYLDLDTGIADRNQPSPPGNTWDIFISPDNTLPDTFYVHQNQMFPVSTASLTGIAYNAVTFNDFNNAFWDTMPTTTVFDTNTVMLVTTDMGRFFKVGNPVYNQVNWTMQFDYEEVFPPPPPARDEYLAIYSDYLDLDTATAERDQWGGPQNMSWDIQITEDTNSPGNFFLHQNIGNWVQIAHLPGAVYENVIFDDALNAIWDPSHVNMHFATDRTILLLTDQGRYFKVGNPYFDNYMWRMHFDYEELVPPPPPPPLPGQEYLGIDADYLDLDNGTIDRDQWNGPPTNGWDVKIGYDPYIVDTYDLFINDTNWVQIAHLHGMVYENVTFNDALNAAYTNVQVYEPFDTNRTIVVMTNEGRYFKLGNPVFDQYYWRMTFSYEELIAPPPPPPLPGQEYLGIDADYMDLDNGTIDRDQWNGPPANGWDIKIGYDPYIVDTYDILINDTNWVQIAHLHGMVYENVTFNDAINAAYTNMQVYEPFDTNRTILVMTNEGRYFKLGNPVFDQYYWRMTFSYEELIAPPPPPPLPGQEYLGIDADYMDLDTGTIDRDQWNGPPANGWDIKIGYDPYLVDTYDVFINDVNWTNIAHLHGMVYENVTFNDAINAPYTNVQVHEPFDTNRTIVIMTDQGRYYKLGNPVFDQYYWRMTFSWEELTPPPPPARDEYLGVDYDYLDLDAGTVERDVWANNPITPWDVRITPDYNLVDTYWLDQNTYNAYTAHLIGATYENVSWNDVLTANFQGTTTQENFGTDRTILVMTDQGRYFKLGNPYFDMFMWQMHFDYEEILPPAAPTRDEWLGIDSDYLNMDTPSVERDQWGIPVDAGWDVRIAYDGINYYVNQNMPNAYIAHLPGATYENVDFNDVMGAPFFSHHDTTAFAAGNVVLVMTDQGRYFKMGNAYFDSFTWRMHFDYEEVLPPPPPARDEYLGIDSDYLNLDTGSIERDMWGGPTLPDWDVRIAYNGIDNYVEQNTPNCYIVHMPNTNYADVDFDDVMAGPFNGVINTTAFTANDVVLIMTDQGRYFKLGNPYFDNFMWRLHFDYEEILPPPPPVRDEYLGIDADYLDLDSGATERDLWGITPTINWDMSIVTGFQPDTFYVRQNINAGNVIAHLVGQDYATVTWDDLQNAMFDGMHVDQNFGTDRTLIIMTDQGRYFKIGNPAMDNYTWRMHFDYEELLPPPPPVRDTYLGMDYDFLDLDNDLVERDVWGLNPTIAWDVRVAHDPQSGNDYLEQNTFNGLQIAHLVGRDYSTVTAADIPTATFTSSTVLTQFNDSDTILVTTDNGRTFKVGNPVFDWYNWRYYFDYQEL